MQSLWWWWGGGDRNEDASLTLPWDHIQIVWIIFPDQIPLDYFRRLNDPLGSRQAATALCRVYWPMALRPSCPLWVGWSVVLGFYLTVFIIIYLYIVCWDVRISAGTTASFIDRVCPSVVTENPPSCSYRVLYSPPSVAPFLPSYWLPDGELRGLWDTIIGKFHPNYYGLCALGLFIPTAGPKQSHPYPLSLSLS